MEIVAQYITDLKSNELYFLLFSFVLGATLASFISFLACRYKKNVDIEVNKIKEELGGIFLDSSQVSNSNLLAVRSSCFHCGKKIPIYLNIPILGWLLVKGKSRCCNNKLPASYFLSEVWLATLFLIGACFLDSAHALITFWTISSMSFLAAEIDRGTLTIPFSLTSFIAFVYLILTFYFNVHFIESTILALIVGFLLCHVFGFSKLSNLLIGNGDMFFIALFAAVFIGAGEWQLFFTFLVLASIIFVFQNMRRKGKESPMGFSLHLSSTIVLLLHLNNLY